MRLLLALIAFVAIQQTAPPPPQHEHAAGTERLGVVHFETSCAPAVRDRFDRAIAMLHSFWYSAAIDTFNDVLKTDPKCAMAHWGIAMSVWGNPFGGTRTPAAMSRGAAAVEQAKKTGSPMPRERDYIAAVEKLYADADKLDHPTRALAYERAMESITTKYPSDTEATIFYAVALDAAASPTDQTYAKQLKAAGLLEKAFAAQPKHPGISHYLIHSYDYPPLAGKGLPAARRYATIAPDAPHALHMPSHIFTRVGAWDDSVSSNMASAAAAKTANSPGEQLHALDYQTYAYLQMARDVAAQNARKEALQVIATMDPGNNYGFAAFYAAAAIPARTALERGAWSEAAGLDVRPSPFPHADSVTLFARTLGAARAKQPAEARASLAKLAPLSGALREKSEAYWAGQVDIQRQGAEAWTLVAEGKLADGIALMMQAADAEDRTEKNPVTPGPIVPARELLGEMLLDAARPKEALAAFERAMTREPGRFRSLAGAMRAAQAAGDTATARKHAAALLALTKSASPGRPEIAEAKRLASVR
jgi:hypothetical protein